MSAASRKAKKAQRRMASEAIQKEALIEKLGEDILDEIRGESADVHAQALQNAVDDGIRYLNRREPQLDKLRVSGQSYGDIEDELLNLATLRGNVPAPLIDTLPNGNELRTHTRYAVNPVTGMTEVVPFIDKATGDVLETEFGMLNHLRPMTHHRGRGATETASEIVGLNALKLMDEGPAVFSRGPSHYADVNVGDEKTDLMMVRRGGNYNNTINIPRYTNIIKNKNVNLKNEVEKLRAQGLTMEQAVSRLANLGVIQPVNDASFGKLGRANINNVSGDADAVYDSLLVSGYPRQLLEDAIDVKYGRRTSRTPEIAVDFATDKLALAPETLHKVELAGLRDAIDRGEVKTDIFSNRNTGVDGRGHLRDKIQEVIPQNNNPYVTDVTVTHPLTAQLLRNMPII